MNAAVLNIHSTKIREQQGELEMARINIEDCWWTDPRRSMLIRLLGHENKADGAAVQMWRLGQEFWKRDRALVSKQIFETLEFASELLRTSLADVRGEMIYVRGSSVYFEWIYENRESGKAGGKKSAEVRRAKYGSAQPRPRSEPEQKTEGVSNPPSNDISEQVEASEASYSSSYSYNSLSEERESEREKQKNGNTEGPSNPPLEMENKWAQTKAELLKIYPHDEKILDDAFGVMNSGTFLGNKIHNPSVYILKCWSDIRQQFSNPYEQRQSQEIKKICSHKNWVIDPHTGMSKCVACKLGLARAQ